MRKCSLILFLFFINLAGAQQSIISLQRYRGNLTTDSLIANKKPVLLTKFQLQEILSVDQFKSYKTAHNCYVASIPLFTLSGCGVVISATFLGMGIYSELPSHHQDFGHGAVNWIMYMFSGITLGTTMGTLIPAIILYVNSKNKLNKIASNYNSIYKISYNSVRLNLGLTSNGIGIKLNF
jgi:hypothetical protein